ncbi:MAG: PEP-CTERM sorting domain-containing protein [Armatimonadetes bacterium]|nr:PEP-CTERM sorting domain-containing protein [Armatimonadota bacterium]
MRSLSLLVFSVAMAAQASASFDMMLIGNNSGGDFRVSRWDPVNRVSLGSFGSGILTGAVEDVAVNQATGVAYVISANRILTFNYNTGEYLGLGPSSAGLGAIQYNSTSGTVTLGNGYGTGNINQQAYNADLSSAGFSFGSVYVSSAPLRRTGSSNYFAFTLEGSSPFNLSASTWSSAGSFLTVASTGIPFNNVNNGNGLHDSAFSGTKMYGVQWDSSTGTSALWSSETSTGFAATPVLLQTFHSAASNLIRRGISAAHNGGLWVKTGNQYSSYIPGLGMGPTQSLSSLGAAADLTGIAVIVAPEPGSLSVLGLGALVLLRRKVRR